MHRSMLGADRCTSITNKSVSVPTTITVLGFSASDKALETINASAPSKNSDGVCEPVHMLGFAPCQYLTSGHK